MTSVWNIYIFIAIALDEADILVAVYFSMKNSYHSCEIYHALRRSNVNVIQ